MHLNVEESFYEKHVKKKLICQKNSALNPITLMIFVIKPNLCLVHQTELVFFKQRREPTVGKLS